jgi:ArsR family transcriptional regulator
MFIYGELMRELVRTFKALSDPTRLRLFRLLLERDLCVCELMVVLEMPQSRISHQLRLLRDADLVEDKRRGKWIIYTVPADVRKRLEPLVRSANDPGAGGDKRRAGDLARLDLCLREDVRRTRGPQRARRA